MPRIKTNLKTLKKRMRRDQTFDRLMPPSHKHSDIRIKRKIMKLENTSNVGAHVGRKLLDHYSELKGQRYLSLKHANEANPNVVEYINRKMAEVQSEAEEFKHRRRAFRNKQKKKK